MPGPRDMSKMKKPENAGATIKRLLGLLADKKGTLIVVFIFVLLSALCSIYATSLIRPIINDGIIPLIGQPLTSEALAPFYSLLFKLGCLYLASALFSYGYQRIMVNVSNGTLNRFRNMLFDKMQTLPLSYFDSHTHGELMSHYTNDISAIGDAFGSGITQVMSSVVTIIGIMIMMISLSPLMTVAVLIMMSAMFMATKVIATKSIDNFKKQQESVAKLNGCIEETMGGQKVVKVFTHEPKTKAEFNDINEKARKASTRANIYAGIMGPITNNMSHINYALCSILGAYLCIAGSMDIGKLASFLQYTKNFSNPVSQLMQRVNSLLSAVAGAERIFKVLDMEPEIDEGKVTLVNITYDESNQIVETKEHSGLWAWKVPAEDGYSYVKLRGDVRFNNVVFSYDGKKTVLHDVSFYAKPGQKIAFVGSTGAGKTTITNLINRFYDIQSGTITYDGINVMDIKKESLRRSLSMVLQDTHLFTGTVMENIRYGRLDATDEECIEAAKLANADEFITMLSEGYNTVLTGDGANLSQGQRQLLSIARSAVANAPVLILDEATSSIDTRTEKLIEQGMDNLMCGRTVFVIAHRLSTVRNSNAIMVLEQGVIIERGDHDDLIEQKGKYYQLYTGQFELD